MKKTHRYHDWSVLKDDTLINNAAEGYRIRKDKILADRVQFGESNCGAAIEPFCCFLWKTANAQRESLHIAAMGTAALTPVRHLDLDHAVDISNELAQC